MTCSGSGCVRYLRDWTILEFSSPHKSSCLSLHIIWDPAKNAIRSGGVIIIVGIEVAVVLPYPVWPIEFGTKVTVFKRQRIIALTSTGPSRRSGASPRPPPGRRLTSESSCRCPCCRLIVICSRSTSSAPYVA